MELSKMEDFIILTCRHAAKYGVEPKLIKWDTSQGAGISELWKCLVCGIIMRFDSCARARTIVEDAGLVHENHLQSTLSLQIQAIIPHHCGDHSICKSLKFCTYKCSEECEAMTSCTRKKSVKFNRLM
jgi:hypothetical protein